MVARNDGHDHGDSYACPGCRFKAALAEHLTWAAGEGDVAWHAITGEVLELMGTAAASLARLKTSTMSGTPNGDHESAEQAAAAIARIGGVIDEIWHVVIDEPSDNDPSAGL